MNVTLSRTQTVIVAAAIMLLGSLPVIRVVFPAIEIAFRMINRPVPSEVTVYTTQLFNPRGLVFDRDGRLYVAEAGAEGVTAVDVGLPTPMYVSKTGRISMIKTLGQRSTLIEGLPSSVDIWNEEVGPMAVAFMGEELYVLSTAGAGFVDWPGWQNAVLRFTSDGNLVEVADITAFNVTNPSVGRRLKPNLLNTSPGGMPFGLAVLNGALYLTDGNHDQVLRVTPTGEVTRFFDFKSTNRVPTGITTGPDGRLYVTEFAWRGEVSRLRPDGRSREVIAHLKRPIAAAFDQNGTMYVLEFTGRLLELNGQWLAVLLRDLDAPTAMTFGPDGYLYISNRGHGSSNGEGEILRVRVGSPLSLSYMPRTLVYALLRPGTVGPFLIGLILASAFLFFGMQTRKAG